MGRRSKRNSIKVEWTIGELTFDGAGEMAAPRHEIFAPSSSTVTVTRQAIQQPAQQATRQTARQAAHSAPPPVQTQASRPSHTTLWSELQFVLDIGRWVVLAVVALGIVSAASPSPKAAQRTALINAVERSLSAEDAAWRSGNEDSFAHLLDEDAPSAWYRNWRKSWQVGQIHADSRPALTASQLQNLYMHNGIAVAEIQVDRPPSNPWKTSPLVETRFYRPAQPISTNSASTSPTKSERQVWLRTAPDPAFWGEALALETAHLRFDYHARDAVIIESTAPLLDEIYVSLHRLVGEPAPPTSPKLNLVLVQSVEPRWDAPGNVVEMVSPTLMARPPSLTPAETFIDTVFTRLSFRVLDQAVPGTRGYWDSLSVGIRAWLRTKVTDIPSPWHEQSDELFYETLRLHMPISGFDVADSRRVKLPMNDTLVWQYRLAQSIIEYSVETSGPGALPRLIEGFGKYRRWGELVPFVYGVPAQEWEVGWNDYLRRNLKLRHEANSDMRADPPINIRTPVPANRTERE